ncbi:MAG: outer membrane lipoprotein carrier protein LolA [Nitrospira sp.]|nr:outer membrane lipoprotein carrier protein LolA [Nitrospira sp.]MCP9464019.1 outer membrane lipoprotein carrier protein LolA [Nitrospira sp.]
MSRQADRQWISLWIGLCLGVVGISPAWASEGGVDPSLQREVQALVKHIQARYEKTKDLQADFVQKTKIEGFERPILSSGKVYLKRPGQLRWDYLEPANERIYVAHDNVKVYVPEHKQVLVGKLTQMAASKAPLELLQGVGKLEESFDIRPTEGKERGAGGLPLLTLLPKTQVSESTKTIQKIVIEVFPKTYFLRAVSLHESGGNVSTFEFSEPMANVGLANEIFEFVIPPDVEVVRAPVFSGP